MVLGHYYDNLSAKEKYQSKIRRGLAPREGGSFIDELGTATGRTFLGITSSASSAVGLEGLANLLRPDEVHWQPLENPSMSQLWGDSIGNALGSMGATLVGRGIGAGVGAAAGSLFGPAGAFAGAKAGANIGGKIGSFSIIGLSSFEDKKQELLDAGVPFWRAQGEAALFGAASGALNTALGFDAWVSGGKKIAPKIVSTTLEKLTAKVGSNMATKAIGTIGWNSFGELVEELTEFSLGYGINLAEGVEQEGFIDGASDVAVRTLLAFPVGGIEATSNLIGDIRARRQVKLGEPLPTSETAKLNTDNIFVERDYKTEDGILTTYSQGDTLLSVVAKGDQASIVRDDILNGNFESLQNLELVGERELVANKKENKNVLRHHLKRRQKRFEGQEKPFTTEPVATEDVVTEDVIAEEQGPSLVTPNKVKVVPREFRSAIEPYRKGKRKGSSTKYVSDEIKKSKKAVRFGDYYFNARDIIEVFDTIEKPSFYVDTQNNRLNVVGGDGQTTAVVPSVSKVDDGDVVYSADVRNLKTTPTAEVRKKINPIIKTADSGRSIELAKDGNKYFGYINDSGNDYKIEIDGDNIAIKDMSKPKSPWRRYTGNDYARHMAKDTKVDSLVQWAVAQTKRSTKVETPKSEPTKIETAPAKPTTPQQVFVSRQGNRLGNLIADTHPEMIQESQGRERAVDLSKEPYPLNIDLPAPVIKQEAKREETAKEKAEEKPKKKTETKRAKKEKSVPAKEEKATEEKPKQEETKQEETPKEEPKQEEPKQETKEEKPKQEAPREESVPEEDSKTLSLSLPDRQLNLEGEQGQYQGTLRWRETDYDIAISTTSTGKTIVALKESAHEKGRWRRYSDGVLYKNQQALKEIDSVAEWITKTIKNPNNFKKVAEDNASPTEDTIAYTDSRVATGDEMKNVPEKIDDTPQAARERGFRRVFNQIIPRQARLTDGEIVIGKSVETRFSTSSKDLVNSRVAVIDIDKLQPSHIDGNRNDQFFIDEAQPKDRIDNVSRGAITSIAQSPNFEELTAIGNAFSGSPIVNRRGEVIQGNNRSAGLKAMRLNYKKNYTDYKQFILDNAERFGLNVADVKKIKNPVLVRLVDVNDTKAIALGQRHDTDVTTGGEQRLQADNLRQALTPEAQNEFIDILFENAVNDYNSTLNSIFDENGLNALQYLVANNFITEAQYVSGKNDYDKITPETKKVFAELIFSKLLNGTSTEFQNLFDTQISSAIKSALAKPLVREYTLDSNLSLIPELREALRLIPEIKDLTKDSPNTPYPKKIEKFINTQSLFGNTPRSPSSLAILQMLQTANSQKVITEELNRYYDDVAGRRKDPRQTEMALFEDDGKLLSKEEALNHVFGNAKKKWEDYLSERNQMYSIGEAPIDNRTKNLIKGMSQTFDVTINFVAPDYFGVLDANGEYLPGRISVNSSKKDIVKFTLGHEIVHHMKETSPVAYESLQKAVYNYLTFNGNDVSQMIADKQEQYSNSGQSLTKDGALEEIVADISGELCYESQLLEQAIEQSADHSWLKTIKGLIRKFLSYFRSMKSEQYLVDNLRNSLDILSKQPETAESLFDINPNDKFVDSSSISKKSIRSLAEAAGFLASKEKDGTIIWVRNGKQIKKVTIDDIDNSPIGALINFSLEEGDITNEQARQQKKLFADICTMAAKQNDFSQAMEFTGSVLFTALKSNSDPQYKTTFDFASICVKTQAVIDAMSATMIKLQRGLSREEIESIYQDVFNFKNLVPCPECYVFSRWIGIGSLLDNIWTYQTKYKAMGPEKTLAEYRELIKEVEAFAEEKGLTKGKAKGGLAESFKKKYENLEKKKEKADSGIGKWTKKDEADMNEFKEREQSFRAISWIEKVYFKDNPATHSKPRVNENFFVPPEILFDLNKGGEFASQYRETWKFRTTQGAGYGKAITPYAESVLGEGILGTIDVDKTAKAKQEERLENIFLSQKGKLTDEAKKLLKKARLKQKVQEFFGGQRYQSTSDARPSLALDYLLSTLELQAMGGTAQTYTKVSGAVPAFAKFGHSVNQSLIGTDGGVDANGKIIDTDVGGMKPETAISLRKKYDNVGTVTIGMNDEHIRAMFNDKNRDYIIPYHASGGKAETIAHLRNLQHGRPKDATQPKSTDYTRTQKEKVLSDALLRSLGKTEQEIELIKARRQARIAIFSSRLKPNMDVVRGSKFLSALYSKLYEDGEFKGVRAPKTMVEDAIFPEEYWDKSVDEKHSYVNVQLYLDYCEELGFLHKFSGKVPQGRPDGTSYLKTMTGYNRLGERVELTDLAYKYDKNGNKTNEIEPYFWKILVDRRMYDNDGNYLPQKKVNLNNIAVKDVTTFAKSRDDVGYDRERSRKTTEAIVSKFSIGNNTGITINKGKNVKTGESVDFIDLIFSGKKLGETRSHNRMKRGWVGIANENKEVVGEIKFGEPIKITKESPEYKDAYIQDTDFDIDDKIGYKYYYPIEDKRMFDSPKPLVAKYQMYNKYSLDGRTQVNPILDKTHTTFAEYNKYLETRSIMRKNREMLNRHTARRIASSGGMDKVIQEILNGRKSYHTAEDQILLKQIHNSEEYRNLSTEERLKLIKINTQEGTNIGQALAARRSIMYNLGSRDEIQWYVDKLISRLPNPEQVLERIKKKTSIDATNLPDAVVNNPDLLEALAEEIALGKATKIDKAYSYWLNSILSAVSTHTPNLIGTALNVGRHYTTKQVEAIGNLFLKNDKLPTFKEFKYVANMIDWKQLIKSAWARGKFAFKYPLLTADGQIDEKATFALGGKAKVLTTPTRLLKFEDELMKGLIEPIEAMSYAYKLAQEKKLTGKDLADFINRELKDKQSISNIHGEEVAEFLAFQSRDVGSVAKMLMTLKKTNPLAKWLFPFVISPANILRQGVRYSPLGIFTAVPRALSKDVGVSEKSSRIAEQVLAWAVTGAVAQMVGLFNDEDDEDKLPLITGNTPQWGSNEQKFHKDKIPPLSIRIGNTYYSYARLEPLATTLALIVDMMQGAKDVKRGKESGVVFKESVNKLKRGILDKSYFTGINSVISILDNPEYSGTDWATNFAASWIPNLVKQPLNAMRENSTDYKVRDYGLNFARDSIVDTIPARMGFIQPAIKRDYLGRPVKRDDGGLISRSLIPIAVVKQKDLHEIDKLILNYNRTHINAPYYPTIGNWTWGDKYMDTKQYDEFCKRAGERAEKELSRLIRQGTLDVEKPSEKDIERIKKVFKDARAKVRERMVKENKFHQKKGSK